MTTPGRPSGRLRNTARVESSSSSRPRCRFRGFFTIPGPVLAQRELVTTAQANGVRTYLATPYGGSMFDGLVDALMPRSSSCALG